VRLLPNADDDDDDDGCVVAGEERKCLSLVKARSRYFSCCSCSSLVKTLSRSDEWDDLSVLFLVVFTGDGGSSNIRKEQESNVMTREDGFVDRAAVRVVCRDLLSAWLSWFMVRFLDFDMDDMVVLFVD